MHNDLMSWSIKLKKLKVYLVSNISRELEDNPPPMDQRREVVNDLLKQIVVDAKIRLPETLRHQVFQEVLDDLLGYGPIQPLLDDPTITEVMVNSFDKIYVERDGKLIKTKIKFN